MEKTSFLSKKYRKIGKRILKEALAFLWLQLLIATPFKAAAEVDFMELLKEDPVSISEVSQEKILNESQIAYRAEGGFSGVISYGVIVSCVKGKISVLRSIHDPRLTNDNQVIRKVSPMNKEEYLNLWANLDKMRILKMEDAPRPRLEILEEFTHKFNLKIGSTEKSFKVHGINRPEAARHFAVKSLIDGASNMTSVWNSHSNLALK